MLKPTTRMFLILSRMPVTGAISVFSRSSEVEVQVVSRVVRPANNSVVGFAPS